MVWEDSNQFHSISYEKKSWLLTAQKIAAIFNIILYLCGSYMVFGHHLTRLTLLIPLYFIGNSKKLKKQLYTSSHCFFWFLGDSHVWEKTKCGSYAFSLHYQKQILTAHHWLSTILMRLTMVAFIHQLDWE